MDPPVVAIVRTEGAKPAGLLDQALARISFNARVAERIKARPDDFSVVIVPALDAYAVDSPTATDPRLVEQLIDILTDLGAKRIIVGATPGAASIWLENRDVFVVADFLGYQFETAMGRSYDIVDLSEDLVEGQFPDASPLAGTAMSREWINADLRIVFAANRTDEGDGYALCLSTLLNVLPMIDKGYHYRARRDVGAVMDALLTAAPVDFALIDAVVSAHGTGGGRVPQPIQTDTVIAATSPVLADHYGAILMGLDPFISPVAAQALRQPGLLDDVRVVGNLAPYPDWLNAPPLLRASVARRSETVALDRAVRPLLQRVDREMFPFRDPANDRLNAALNSISGDDAGGLVTLLNLWLAEIGRAWTAYATLFNKDALRRCEAPINIDPGSVGDADFATLSGEIAPLARLLEGITADANGLRWRSHDGAILFDGVRRFPVRFDAFAGAVEISRTIQFMNDYIGGSAMTVAQDDTGRVTRQIERNLYLPQPNYTVFLGGDLIDVTKLESVTYVSDRQCMVWKTVKSENGSALSDDGIVTFEALGDDTLVTIFGRQQFSLPPLLAAFDLDLVPALKNFLVTEAYSRFFDRTFANLEAVLEGRDVRIGRAWHDDPAGEPLVVELLSRFVADLKDDDRLDLIGWFKSRVTDATPLSPALVKVDADGFRHFEGSAPTSDKPIKSDVAGDILRDLRHAALVDAGMMP
jgi:uncharacterized protein (DUF362 family)